MSSFEGITNHSFSKFCIMVVCLAFVLSISTVSSASNGPSVQQLQKTLNSTWRKLRQVTNCDRPPPQDAMCMQKYHGNTISIELFGQPINLLVLFEETTTLNVLGPVYTQQTGFLVGPLNGYGYKVVNEQQASGLYDNRSISDNGLKVFAHTVTGQTINPDGIELNKGKEWLDGKHEPWIYHWSALAKVRQALKDAKRYIERNYQ